MSTAAAAATVKKSEFQKIEAKTLSILKAAEHDVAERHGAPAAQRLSGRAVTLFVSDSHVGPDMEIELFMLAPPAA